MGQDRKPRDKPTRLWSLIYDKGGKDIQWRKDSLFSKWCWENWIRKQPTCPLTDEWIKKMQYIYTVEYYTAIKRNKIELFVVKWMDIESVIQSEVSQKEKNK